MDVFCCILVMSTAVWRLIKKSTEGYDKVINISICLLSMGF